MMGSSSYLLCKADNAYFICTIMVPIVISNFGNTA